MEAARDEMAFHSRDRPKSHQPITIATFAQEQSRKLEMSNGSAYQTYLITNVTMCYADEDVSHAASAKR